MFLSELKEKEFGKILEVGGEKELRQHFLDMGILPGASIQFVKCAPMGDPMEFTIHGYELTLRKEDASKISIDKMSDEEAKETDGREISGGKKSQSGNSGSRVKRTFHPGLGEGGKFHEKKSENPLPKGTTLTFALVGNQNCGKTTLFNQLTGANQHVGNFPGVTVDEKSGPIKNFSNTKVTDLPGIYSMSPYTPEEIISRNFVLDEKPRGIINIVDATNIERNLYLTMQLLELDIPMVVALNMMDEVHHNGGSIDINRMEMELGVPVVPISAAKNEGIGELIDHAIHVANYQEKPGRQDFCDEKKNGGAVHRALHGVMDLISDHAEQYQVPVRFAASKLIEGDPEIAARLHLDSEEEKLIDIIVRRMEEERKMDRAAAIADMRFTFIGKVTSETVRKPRESKEHERSRKADKILTGKWTAIPAFLLIMGIVFYLTFGLIGPFLQDLLQTGIDGLSETLSAWMIHANVSEWLRSLITDGIFIGVGSVVSFLPVIVLLFLFLSLLEDSGYMARVAFLMDKPLRKMGLSGRSIVPLLVGFGCTVPGVMATRILPSERDRKMTILLTPFMSCTAKLPVYSFFAAAFFPKSAWVVIICTYLLDMLLGILISFLYRKTLFKGDPVPFVMELPNYRFPSFKSVLHLLWDKAKDFLVRAFTVIFIASIVIWFLKSFNFRLNRVPDSAESILSKIAGFLAPVFAPLGFGNWQTVVSLISGFLAKESVVSTLGVLFSGGGSFGLTAASALSLLTFSSLYTPCIAAIASIKKELGRKWAGFVVLWQCVLAWIVAFLVFQIAKIFMG